MLRALTEEFSQSGLGRGVILPLRTDFSIPPRAVTMCTLQGVTPTSAAKRFMDFISESNKMAYDPGHSYHFTNWMTKSASKETSTRSSGGHFLSGAEPVDEAVDDACRRAVDDDGPRDREHLGGHARHEALGLEFDGRRDDTRLQSP